MNNSGQRPPIKGPSPLHHQYCKMPPNNLVERSFKYHLIILKILGLYPFDCCPKIYLPYAFTFYICFTVTIPILALTSIFTTGEHDIEAISQKGFMIVELMALIVKVLPCKVNPEGTRRTMYNLNRDIFNRQLPEQEFILTNCVRNCKYVLMIFFTTCFLAIMTWAVSPLMYDERRFPFSVWLPYEPFENTKIYLASYTLIFLCK